MLQAMPGKCLDSQSVEPKYNFRRKACFSEHSIYVVPTSLMGFCLFVTLQREWVRTSEHGRNITAAKKTDAFDTKPRI